MSPISPKRLRECGWTKRPTKLYGCRSSVATGGGVNRVDLYPTLKSTTNDFRSQSGRDSEQNLITLCAPCHAAEHR
jgi:cytochrome c553